MAGRDPIAPDLRVLLANGDEFIVAYLQRLLGRLGLEDVITATSGVEALQRLSCGGFDLLLLDLELHNISGLELLSMLRADPKSARTPVVVTTGVCQVEIVRQALTLGVADYLLKPFQERVVGDRIKRIINAAREGADGQSDGKVQILIADRDRVFAETAQSALEPYFGVAVAKSLFEWAALATKLKPGGAIIDPAAFGGRTGLALDALQRACRPGRARIALIGSDAALEQRPDYVGSIPKTFVPERLVEAARQAFQKPSEPDPILRLLADDLRSITRQALGVMTGVEAQPCDPPSEFQADLAVSVRLAGDDDASWRVWVAAPVETARRITADFALVDVEETLGHEPEGIKELANLVARRLKRFAADQHRRLDPELPVVEAELIPGKHAITHWFSWDERLRFAVGLEDGAAMPTSLAEQKAG